MGCVSFKGFRRGPDRENWYTPMPCNVSASMNQRFREQKEVDHDQDNSLTASSYGELDIETCQGSFLNMRRKVKHYKVLPPHTELEDSFTFTSNLEVNHTSTYDGTQPIMQGDFSKRTFMCNNRDAKPIGVQKSTEPDEEKKRFLMCDLLELQQMVACKRTKGSLWEEDIEGHFVWDNCDVKDGRAYAGCERGLQENGKKSADKCDISDATLVGACEGTEIINLQELMEGLNDSTRIPSFQRSRVRDTLSIPQREISFSPSRGTTSVPGSDLGSPVWMRYYTPDNGVACTNTWNMHSPATSSPFNESPRRAPSQISFNDVDDARSVSSIEVSDANAIGLNAVGLKILLSPANSSFHPSPVNRAHSTILSCDGNTHGLYGMNTSDENNAHFGGPSYDVKSPFRSRKPSTESIFGSVDYEHVGNAMNALYRSPNMTTPSSRRLSMESGYGSGSPLFDPSLMATFEEALKASMGVYGYDDWHRSSIEASVTLPSSSANTWELFNTSMEVESTPSEQSTEKPSLFPLYGLEVKSKAGLASYDFKCPPRGEGKVVLYFTSLRGIRKTYEDCFNIRLILRGLGVQVDERDVWMHSEFKSELNDVLSGLCKGMPQVPQLFIKGRYIGGAEVVKQLHEEGALLCLMDGLALGLIHSVCDGCGDARFIPCFTCNGSRKVLNVDNKVTQCLACNENGLIMCPRCIT